MSDHEIQPHEDQGHEPPKREAEQLGETALKYLADTAFAVAGLAASLADRAKEYYEEQRREAVERQDEDSLQHKAFVQAPDEVRRLLDELASGYQELVRRGREAVRPADAAPRADDSPSEGEDEAGSQGSDPQD